MEDDITGGLGIVGETETSDNEGPQAVGRKNASPYRVLAMANDSDGDHEADVDMNAEVDGRSRRPCGRGGERENRRKMLILKVKPRVVHTVTVIMQMTEISRSVLLQIWLLLLL